MSSFQLSPLSRHGGAPCGWQCTDVKKRKCYVQPRVSVRYTVRPKPQRLALNCNCSLVAVIDATGLLAVLDLETKVGILTFPFPTQHGRKRGGRQGF